VLRSAEKMRWGDGVPRRVGNREEEVPGNHGWPVGTCGHNVVDGTERRGIGDEGNDKPLDYERALRRKT